MSNLIPATGGGNSNFLGRREDRGVVRQIGGPVGSKAVAMVSQMDGQLGQACPLAVTRLQGIADMTALSIAQVVADSARTIGR